MADSTSLTKALTQIDSILENDVNSLVRTDLGTELNFSEGKVLFEEIMSVFQMLKTCKLESVPNSLLNEIHATVRIVKEAFDQIFSFSIKNLSDPIRQRDEILRGLKRDFDDRLKFIAPVLSFGANQEINDSNNRKLSKDLEKKLEEVESAYQKIQQILKDSQSAASKVGVSEHSTHFDKQATEHKKSAFVWLLITASFGFVTLFVTMMILLANIFNWYEMQALSNENPVGIALSKFALFALLYTSTIWAGRMYKSHSHNYVINTHRRNALSTFGTFADATNDDATKNAVLIQATQSIFAHQQSGYINNDSSSDAPPQILEIVRNMTQSKP